jgi:hypothetical protein
LILLVNVKLEKTIWGSYVYGFYSRSLVLFWVLIGLYRWIQERKKDWIFRGNPAVILGLSSLEKLFLLGSWLVSVRVEIEEQNDWIFRVIFRNPVVMLG